MLSAAPSKKRRAVLQIGFETCANLLLRRHNYYSGIRAVLASLASSNTEISCLIHVAPVLFFYGGAEVRWPRGAIQLSILIPSKLDNFQFLKLHFSKLYYFQRCIFPNSIISKLDRFQSCNFLKLLIGSHSEPEEAGDVVSPPPPPQTPTLNLGTWLLWDRTGVVTESFTSACHA